MKIVVFNQRGNARRTLYTCPAGHIAKVQCLEGNANIDIPRWSSIHSSSTNDPLLKQGYLVLGGEKVTTTSEKVRLLIQEENLNSNLKVVKVDVSVTGNQSKTIYTCPSNKIVSVYANANFNIDRRDGKVQNNALPNRAYFVKGYSLTDSYDSRDRISLNNKRPSLLTPGTTLKTRVNSYNSRTTCDLFIIEEPISSKLKAIRGKKTFNNSSRFTVYTCPANKIARVIPLHIGLIAYYNTVVSFITNGINKFSSNSNKDENRRRIEDYSGLSFNMSNNAWRMTINATFREIGMFQPKLLLLPGEKIEFTSKGGYVNKTSAEWNFIIMEEDK